MIKTPHETDFKSNDIKIANMQAFDITNTAIDDNIVFGKYYANSVTRYRDHDEIDVFRGKYIRDAELHELKSDTGLIKNGTITLDGNSTYVNHDLNLTYKTQTLFYDGSNLISKTPFVMTRFDNKITGQSAKYNLKTKKIEAKKVQGWIQKK